MYKILVSWIRRNFGISRTEINGYSILIALFIILHFTNRYYPDRAQLSVEKDENSDSIWALLQSVDNQESRSMQLSSFNSEYHYLRQFDRHGLYAADSEECG